MQSTISLVGEVDGLPGAAARTVFSAAGREYRWSDVVEAARVRGDWEAIAERASGAGAGVSFEDWRRAHRLLTRDETVAWLARWGLQLADVHRHLGLHDGSGSVGRAHRAWAEAVCSGELARLAWRLAASIACAALPPGPEAPLTPMLLAGLDAEFERGRGELAVASEVDELLAEHGEDWAAVAAVVLRFDRLDAAREAALCVRHDRMPIAEVAAVSGVAVMELGGLLDDFEEPLRGVLASAAAGELVGPVATADGFRLVELCSRVPASAADPVVVERARGLAVSRAVERAIGQRVLWRERL